jgi:hypothetical protein
MKTRAQRPKTRSSSQPTILTEAQIVNRGVAVGQVSA